MVAFLPAVFYGRIVGRLKSTVKNLLVYFSIGCYITQIVFKFCLSRFSLLRNTIVQYCAHDYIHDAASLAGTCFALIFELNRKTGIKKAT